MKKWVFISFLFLGFYSCETEFTPDTSSFEEEIVVEGYIEAGDESTPPYVFLTKSQSFFSEINTDNFDDLFIHDADVSVMHNNQSYSLSEVCLNDLTPAQQIILADFLGTNIDSIGINFCVYTDLTFSLLGEEGEQYDLSINVYGIILTASTTIPNFVPLDSMKFSPIPDPDNDTLQELTGFISDPINELNFYRYFTRVNQESFIPGLGSVSDDKVFDGQSFEFPLPRGQAWTEEIDPNVYGYFTEGDTVTIKWCTIDKDHFDFWNTLEYNTSNQGPFSTYTLIDSNVNGGLGIWGGYAVQYYTEIVPFE